MALWCRLNVETLSRYFLHVYVSQNRYWERVPTKIKHCAANFQILKIAETLAISDSAENNEDRYHSETQENFGRKISHFNATHLPHW